jgi:hypothetical protein
VDLKITRKYFVRLCSEPNGTKVTTVEYCGFSNTVLFECLLATKLYPTLPGFFVSYIITVLWFGRAPYDLSYECIMLNYRFDPFVTAEVMSRYTRVVSGTHRFFRDTSTPGPQHIFLSWSWLCTAVVSIWPYS